MKHDEVQYQRMRQAHLTSKNLGLGHGFFSTCMAGAKLCSSRH
jgi:hypothetical protein